MRTFVGCSVVLVTSFVAGAANAQYTAAPNFGSASYATARDCGSQIVCDGSGQAVLDRQYAGGLGQSVDTQFRSGAATTPVSSTAKTTYATFGLPELKLSATSGLTSRIANTVYSFQTYTYDGNDDLDLLLNANYHIVNSSTDGIDGNSAGGARAAAGFAVWNAADFFAYLPQDSTRVTSQVLSQYGFLFGSADMCAAFDPRNGDPSPRAFGNVSGGLSGGANQSLGIAQQNCYGEQTVTFEKGDQFVIAAYAQLTANRGGWADATGTFTVGLDPAMGESNVRNFAAGASVDPASIAGAVPEPASWAMMIGGFGLVGAVLRRRERLTVRFA